MNIDQAANARYGRIVLVSYAVLNGLLLTVVCAGAWFLAVRANSHGIAPNTSLGFRSQHTLASLHGWYVAQRVGFHFAAVADTIVTVVVFAIVAAAFIRRLNPIWILIIPIIGGIGVGVCFMIAGQKADRAAISVKTTDAPKAESTMGHDFGLRSRAIVSPRNSAKPARTNLVETVSPCTIPAASVLSHPV